MRLACPSCGSDEFQALEQISNFVPCRFDRDDNGGIEIEHEAKGEFVREDATAITVLYKCAVCDFNFVPHQIEAALVLKA